MDRLGSDPEYIEEFRAAFGTAADAITAEHAAEAIASYERTLMGGGSAFDRFLYKRKRRL